MSRSTVSFGAAAVLAVAAAGAISCGPGPVAATPPAPAAPNKTPAAECPAAPPAPDASPTKIAAVHGKPVAKLCVYGVDGDARAAALKALKSKEGEPLDAERVREDIGALLKLGTIDDATVSALPSADGVVALYALKERPRIAEVSFEGAHVFEKEGLTGKVAIEKLRPLVPSEVQDLVTAMREEYGRRGYRSAKIDAKTEPAGPNQVRLRFVVVEGPQWKVGKVSFKGTKVAEADLKKAVGLEEGAPFDDEKIERATLQLNALYYDRGMLQARVDRVVGEPDKDGKTPVTFTVEEGDVYRVGKIALGKLAAADDKALLAKMKTKPKQVFSRSVLVDDLKMLTETFGARGQKVDVVPRTELDAKKKTVDLTLDVEASP